MKIKEWLKDLKVPKLIIEVVLVFGSVYFALILEADRSRDFERKILISELNSLKNRIPGDSIMLVNFFLDTSVNPELIPASTTHDYVYSRCKNFIKYVNSENSDTIILAKALFNFQFEKWYPAIKLPVEVKKINENYWSLLINKSTKDTLELIINGYSIIDTDFLAMEETRKIFKESINNEIRFQGENSEELILKILKEPRCYNYLTEIKRIVSELKILNIGLINYYPILRNQINREIQAQEDAMEGIF